MGRRAIVLLAVVVAAGAVLSLKPDRAQSTSASGEVLPSRGTSADLVLFANPAEAGTSCGCAEIIRMTRSAGDAPGVVLREVDPRAEPDLAQRFGVRIAPTVIFIGSDGNERARFEGESGQVIEALREELRVLDGEV